MSSVTSGDVFVVDTNIISFIFKRDTRGDLYKPYLEDDDPVLLIAAQTRAELEFWVLNRNWGLRRKLEFHQHIATHYLLAEANESVALRWAEIQDNARRTGHPIAEGDSWIAATALANDAPLITHNPDDFRYVPDLVVITEK